MRERQGPKLFSAAFSGSDRYTAAPADSPLLVIVDGVACDGVLVASNGPRVRVRFERDGSSFVQWFDRDDLQAPTADEWPM